MSAVNIRNKNEMDRGGSQRFIEYITHLILKILRRHQRVQKLQPPLPLQRHDLATRAPHIRVNIERLPQMVNRRGPGHGADVEEDANVGLEDGAEGVEEPAVGVYLFLVFFFEAEDDLDGDDSFFCAFDFVGRGDGDCFTRTLHQHNWKQREEKGERRRERERTLCRILIYMRRNRLPIHDILRNPILIRPHRRDDTQRPRINLLPPIAHHTHNNLLPPVLAPRLAPIPLTQMRDILHDAVHRPREQSVVFIVHRHYDEEFRAPRGVVMYLTEREAGVFEVVRVAGGGGVTHVGEFALVALGAHVQQFGRDGGVEDEVAVEESVRVDVRLGSSDTQKRRGEMRMFAFSATICVCVCAIGPRRKDATVAR